MTDTAGTVLEDELRDMRCLTVHQPWAELLCDGLKWVENRTWRTSHRGPLGIHAGLRRPAVADLAQAGFADTRTLPRGAMIGTVDVVACLRNEAGRLTADSVRRLLRAADRDVPCGELNIDSVPGIEFVQSDAPFWWVVNRPRRLERPVPRRGQTSLWRF